VKPLDRYLQRARIKRARTYIGKGDDVLDVGCADGQLFRALHGYMGRGIGIDPSLAVPVTTPDYRLIPGTFPAAVPEEARVDVITMLAVLEHLPPSEQEKVADACARILRPGGRVVITVPSPRVDSILHVLERLRLIDGISLHEHYGFEAEGTPALFPADQFALTEHRRFQLGLNNLFVFTRR
jgi:2-polyprenyl-3-methyl-5-hydroxy-6-metoxy-1,4-benzoquinol methylase